MNGAFYFAMLHKTYSSLYHISNFPVCQPPIKVLHLRFCVCAQNMVLLIHAQKPLQTCEWKVAYRILY